MACSGHEKKEKEMKGSKGGMKMGSKSKDACGTKVKKGK